MKKQIPHASTIHINTNFKIRANRISGGRTTLTICKSSSPSISVTPSFNDDDCAVSSSSVANSTNRSTTSTISATKLVYLIFFVAKIFARKKDFHKFLFCKRFKRYKKITFWTFHGIISVSNTIHWF